MGIEVSRFLFHVRMQALSRRRMPNGGRTVDMLDRARSGQKRPAEASHRCFPTGSSSDSVESISQPTQGHPISTSFLGFGSLVHGGFSRENMSDILPLRRVSFNGGHWTFHAP